MQVIEAKHYRGDECIWEAYDLPNIYHQTGEQFVLSVAFNTASATVPLFYYLGLDNRTTLSYTDTLSNLSGEPSANINGYARQPLSSASGFSVALNSTTGHIKATSGIVAYNASGGPWGPVQNIFLATTIGNTGTLIASVPLSGSRTLNDGDRFTARIGLSLTNC